MYRSPQNHLGLAAAVAGCGCPIAMAAAAPADRSTAEAVDRGLAFVGRQQRADGSFAAAGSLGFVWLAWAIMLYRRSNRPKAV